MMLSLLRPRRMLPCALLVAIALCSSQASAATSSGRSGNWSDPATWSTGQLPDASDAVTISAGDTVVYDLASARVAGLTVEDGATLTFHPDRDVTLESDENVLVRGRLVMRPKAPDNDGWQNSLSAWRPYFVHTLRFVNIDEGDFVGGGMDVVASDIGLWVRGDGVLDIKGAAKTGWTRLAGAARAGDTSLALDRVPEGWRNGDKIVLVPSGPVQIDQDRNSGSWSRFEERRIEFANGATVNLDAPLAHDHPVAVGARGTYAAEVLNLSRNVRIEGTGDGSFEPSRNGRAHVHIMSNAASRLEYTELRLMGPRASPDEGVLGRYPLHFHHSMNGARGTIVQGVVVHQSGNRAFVPHASHGITLRDTIAYDITESAYWWDMPATMRNDTDNSHDILIDGAIAAAVTAKKGYRTSGFALAGGLRNTLRNSVAVGVGGDKEFRASQASGFHWPEDINNNDNVWIFESNMAHNNAGSGIFIWQNCVVEECAGPHVVDGYVGYNNGGADNPHVGRGIDHGAYVNAYQFLNLDLFGNEHHSIAIHAAGIDRGLSPIRPDGYINVYENFSAESPLRVDKHRASFSTPSLVMNCSISGGVVVNEKAGEANSGRGLIDFVNCGLEPADFAIESMHSNSVFRIQRADGSAYTMDGRGRTTVIPAFYDTGSQGGGGDSESPTAPSALTAAATSSSRIDLSWTASTDNVGVSSYRVYRDGSAIATVSGTDHSDTGLAPDTSHVYEVAAIDAAGNESSRSPAAQATTLSDEPDDPGDDPDDPGDDPDGPGDGTDGDDALVQWDGPQDFNGTSDFVDLGAIDVAGTEITIVARFSANTFACPDCPLRDGRLVSKATGMESVDHYWMLSTNRSGSSTRLRARLKTNGSTSTLVAGSGNLQPGTSYHAAAAYDGKRMRLYLDGALVGSMAKSGSINTNGAAEAWIGANPDGGRWWDGVISDVRIYDRALSTSEIEALVHQGH